MGEEKSVISIRKKLSSLLRHWYGIHKLDSNPNEVEGEQEGSEKGACHQG